MGIFVNLFSSNGRSRRTFWNNLRYPKRYVNLKKTWGYDWRLGEAIPTSNYFAWSSNHWTACGQKLQRGKRAKQKLALRVFNRNMAEKESDWPKHNLVSGHSGLSRLFFVLVRQSADQPTVTELNYWIEKSELFVCIKWKYFEQRCFWSAFSQFPWISFVLKQYAQAIFSACWR